VDWGPDVLIKKGQRRKKNEPCSELMKGALEGIGGGKQFLNLGVRGYDTRGGGGGYLLQEVFSFGLRPHDYFGGENGQGGV